MQSLAFASLSGVYAGVIVFVFFFQGLEQMESIRCYRLHLIRLCIMFPFGQRKVVTWGSDQSGEAARRVSTSRSADLKARTALPSPGAARNRRNPRRFRRIFPARASRATKC